MKNWIWNANYLYNYLQSCSISLITKEMQMKAAETGSQEGFMMQSIRSSHEAKA